MIDTTTWLDQECGRRALVPASQPASRLEEEESPRSLPDVSAGRIRACSLRRVEREPAAAGEQQWRLHPAATCCSQVGMRGARMMIIIYNSCHFARSLAPLSRARLLA